MLLILFPLSPVLTTSRHTYALGEEDQFEVTGTLATPNGGGPHRARQNAYRKLPKLFAGCNVFLRGDFKPPYPNRQAIAKILQAGGARVLSREPGKRD